MAQISDGLPANFLAAFDAPATERQAFIRKVYGLFTVTLAASGILAYAITQLDRPAVASLARLWPLWIAAWYGLQWFGDRIARAGSAAGYALLGGFVVVTACLAGPLLTIYAASAGGAAIVVDAFALATFTFGGLTAYVLIRKQDFSWMGGALSMGLTLLIGISLISIFLPFPTTAGLVFSAVSVVAIAAAVLYETSNILHHYSTEQAPLAAARIYAAFFALFMHLLRLLSSRK
ncbi:MAG: Bax inhibitor-1 family protein [Planctomycetales bacterium]|nr:Bax inhibitor-1 family protein [Planctomycetales bacterium]